MIPPLKINQIYTESLSDYKSYCDTDTSQFNDSETLDLKV